MGPVASILIGSHLVKLASLITDVQQTGELQLGPGVRESSQAAAICEVPHAHFACVGCCQQAPPAGIKGHGRQLCIPMQVREVSVSQARVCVPHTDCPAVVPRDSLCTNDRTVDKQMF